MNRRRRKVWQALLCLTVGIGTIGTAFRAVAARPTLISALPQQQGNQLIVNGQTFAGAWRQWIDPSTGQPAIALSDSAWMRAIGGDLLDNSSPTQQPIQWFTSTPLTVPVQLSPTARLLNLTQAIRQWGWQVQAQGGTLALRTPTATVQAVRLGQQPWGRRLVLTLDRPTPWTMAKLTNSRTGRTDREFSLQLDATLSPAVLQGFAAKPGTGLKSLKLTPNQGQLTVQGTIEGTFHPAVWTTDNPPRLVVDLRQSPLKSRRIVWAPGLEWRESVIPYGESQFPVTWLAINPRQPGLKIQPIWGNPTGILGIDPLVTMSQRNQVLAAINAGFFSRDRQSPLGAIRRDGVWVSSPILGRGAIGWSPQGAFKVGRLMLQETLITRSGRALPLASSNSGYPQKGIARYTSAWGSAYSPLLQNEQVITVVNQQVQSIRPSQPNLAFPIPSNGFLLVLRAIAPDAELSPGMQVQYQARTTLPAFENLPNIVGGGPLLVQDGQIVENTLAEQFSPTFAQQAADRSGIGQTADGTVVLAVTHNRIGGAGPTLREWAYVMRSLGAVNALNLDGGSSTALYLGGQLLDRHPVTAARVHNAIGIFIQP
ncbi:MAG TPA: phosphodiester glycosidase family protein [Stenomitos sp.]